MSKLILDDDLRAKLNGMQNTVEVCDEAGNVVGRFVPENFYQTIMDIAAPPRTEAERQQMLQEYRDGKCYTTAQVLERLRTLDKKLRGEN